MKQIYTLVLCCIAAIVCTTNLQAQCCHAPDSLKVKSVTDSSFCVQWKISDSLHCDSAKGFQVEYKPVGTITWTIKTRVYTGSSQTFTYCDTASACTKYQWRVRNACIHNGDTLLTAWISGPQFTTGCDSGKVYTGVAGTRLQTAHALSLSPNPAKSSIVISGNYSGRVQITITNMTGSKVFTQSVQTSEGRFSLPININTFNKGIYFVTVSDQRSSTKINFIKE